jgi:hypothetical protein
MLYFLEPITEYNLQTYNIQEVKYEYGRFFLCVHSYKDLV